MARKKVDPLVGVGRDPENKLTVQKSRPLTALWQSDLTLAEFKILDTYLSRIDSHKPQQRTVVFEKGEIERCLGLKQIKPEELKARIKNLGQGIDVPDEHRPGKFKTFWLFEEAECDPGDDGIWTVKLTCNEKSRQYFFNVEKLGYLRYKLRSVTSLQSRYTYILFVYLESNRFRGTWEVDLEELKQILNCHEDILYSEYKRFNERILKRGQKELSDKTECRFTYKPIRKGRPVTAIRFTLEPLSPKLEAEILDVDPNQITIFDDDDLEGDPNAIYADVLPEGLTPDQVEALRTLAAQKVPFIPDGIWPREAVIADYLRAKVVTMRAAGKDVKHPFGYLKAMIENDEA